MKEKIKVIDRDQLKYIAALLMFIGHLLTYTVDELHFWGFPSFVVRILIYSMYAAPPIFIFFISEGFNYTNSKSKYVIRLLITGVITQFAFVLANVGSMDWNMFLYSGNIILTLLISLFVLIIYTSKMHVFPKFITMIALILLTYLWNMEWAVVAPLMVLAFYLLRGKPIWRFVVYESLMMGYVVITNGELIALVQNVCFLFAVQVPIIMITFCYSGKKGKYPSFSKSFFYVFYPAHLFMIFIIKMIVK